jgi:plastocyanin
VPRLLPALLAALALASGGALAACGSDSGSTSGTSTGSVAPATTAATPATPAAPAPPTTPADGQQDPAAPNTGAAPITMKDIAFDAKETTVKVGQEVVWTNEDTVQHNVVADTGATFKSSVFGKGGTYSYTPTKSGTITYECTLHPGMVGTLKVISGP